MDPPPAVLAALLALALLLPWLHEFNNLQTNARDSSLSMKQAFNILPRTLFIELAN